MLSYEDIFTRHARPTTYLTRTMESPGTRRRTPVILRSLPAQKEVRRPRPFSTSSLDRHFTTTFIDVAPSYNSKFATDFGSTYISKPFIDTTPRRIAKPTTDNSRRYISGPCIDTRPRSFSKPPSDNSNRYMSKPLADITPRFNLKTSVDDNTKELNRLSINAPTRYTSKPSIDVIPRHISEVTFDNDPRNIAKPFLNKVPKLNISASALESIPRHTSDNYRLGSIFGEKRLGRREVPLCTLDDLLDIILEPTGYYELPTDPWNEVYPDIYLSDAPTALCTSILKRIGITHVLNAAQGKEKGCGQVNTWSGYYSQSGIKFLGVPAFDNVVFKIYPYFKESAEFIEDGLKSKGKVLVHCRAGISRSATLVCAFLMLKRGLSVQEAVRAVRKHRAIIPNDGFLRQLCDLNDKLKKNSKL